MIEPNNLIRQRQLLDFLWPGYLKTPQHDVRSYATSFSVRASCWPRRSGLDNASARYFVSI